MEYRKTTPLRFDPGVQEIQRKLNRALAKAKSLVEADFARTSMSMINPSYLQPLKHLPIVPADWNIIQEDGYFGDITEKTVRSLQRFLYISENGIMGDYTHRMMMNLLETIVVYPPMICKIEKPMVAPPKQPTLIENIFTGIGAIEDFIENFLSGISDFVSGEIEHASKHGSPTKAGLRNRFFSFAMSQSSQTKNLERLIKDKAKAELEKGALKDAYREASRYHKNRTFPQKMQDIKVQQTYNKLNTKTNTLNKSIPKAKTNFIKDLEKYNIVGKIDKFLADKGWFSGKIEIKALQKFDKLKSIKVSGGGILFTLLGAKDVIWDLCQFTHWGEEEWKEKLKKDFYAFLDGFVISFASAVIAELIVGAVLALAGATIAGGWVVAIVAIVAILIGALISWIMEKAEVSFAEKAIEGYDLILQAVTF